LLLEKKTISVLNAELQILQGRLCCPGQRPSASRQAGLTVGEYEMPKNSGPGDWWFAYLVRSLTAAVEAFFLIDSIPSMHEALEL
jgi:hypothetical protein